MIGTPFAETGHPVFVPGSMGSSSYILRGTEKGLAETFGSCCHGAGRFLSRREALRRVDPGQLVKTLEREGIVVMGSAPRGLAEEAPEAYKDVSRVVSVLEGEGLAVIVARLEPLAVVKG
jgi:tRNA-splicing ligase RtcB